MRVFPFELPYEEEDERSRRFPSGKEGWSSSLFDISCPISPELYGADTISFQNGRIASKRAAAGGFHHPQALPRSRMSPRDLYLQHLPHIEKAARYTARRNRLRPEDAEDFLSNVHLKLIEDDYRVIRQHKGKSSLATYLVIVIHNSMRDYKNHLWGKWRGSAEAKALGSLAIRLEELIVRDQLTSDEAYEVLKTTEKEPVSRRDIEDLMAHLPHRCYRRMEGEEQLRDLAAGWPNPEERLLNREDRASSDRAVSALRQALTSLEAEDQVILKMCGDFKIREIAKLLGKEERALYRRIDKVKKGLRRTLEENGIGPEHGTAPETE